MAVLILPADTLELGVTPGDRTETPISIVDDDGKLLQNGSFAVNYISTLNLQKYLFVLKMTATLLLRVVT